MSTLPWPTQFEDVPASVDLALLEIARQKRNAGEELSEEEWRTWQNYHNHINAKRNADLAAGRRQFESLRGQTFPNLLKELLYDAACRYLRARKISFTRRKVKEPPIAIAEFTDVWPSVLGFSKSNQLSSLPDALTALKALSDPLTIVVQGQSGIMQRAPWHWAAKALRFGDTTLWPTQSNQIVRNSDNAMDLLEACNKIDFMCVEQAALIELLARSYNESLPAFSSGRPSFDWREPLGLICGQVGDDVAESQRLLDRLFQTIASLRSCQVTKFGLPPQQSRMECETFAKIVGIDSYSS